MNYDAAMYYDSTGQTGETELFTVDGFGDTLFAEDEDGELYCCDSRMEDPEFAEYRRAKTAEGAEAAKYQQGSWETKDQEFEELLVQAYAKQRELRTTRDTAALQAVNNVASRILGFNRSPLLPTKL
jgi:hypothetical protein